MEDWRGRREDMSAQLRMNAVGADYHIGFGNGAIREPHTRAFLILLEGDGAVAGTHDPRRQMRREKLDEISAVHAEAGTPAGRIGDLDRRDRRTVVAKV